MGHKTRIVTILAVFSAFFLLACGGGSSVSTKFYNSYERGDCLTNRFDEVNDDLDITAGWKYDTLHLDWDDYKGDGFNGYYIVRAEGSSNSCPYFYIGSNYHKYIGRKSQSYFSDEAIESGETYYYRVCVKLSGSSVQCGAVQKISIY